MRALAFAVAAALGGSAAAQELGIPQGSGQQAGTPSAQAASKSGQVILMPSLTAGAANTLSLLSSNDGANFVSLASETWTPPSGKLSDPTLARHADGRYVLAYAGAAPGSIGLASSQDLRRWEATREVGIASSQVRTPNWVRGADGQLHLVATIGRGSHVLTPDAQLANLSAPAPMRGLEDGYTDTVVAPEGDGFVAVAREAASGRLVLARAADLKGPWRVEQQSTLNDLGTSIKAAGLVRLGATLRLYTRGDDGQRAWFADSQDGGRTWSAQSRLLGTAAMASSFGVMGEDAKAFDRIAAPKGRPKTIAWDEYSLKVDGKRIVVWSGEIHPFRLPNPSLWRDVIQKMKALGFNGVAFYFDWGYHSPAPGVYDFSGIRNVERALQIAKE
ncbi:beta-galactosidase, partial [Massilia alkalitolerans]|uniref:beta-galactosidase n=1 Tax=Massilia alkalitolerans TaxID=286638 RepID=UPI0028A5E03A